MASEPSVSEARWMVAVMGCVVLAFLASTGASQYIEDAIAKRASELISNAMPSVELLSAARGHLHHLERELERGDSNTDEPRQDLEQALASYATTPQFRGEAPLYAHVTANLATLDRDRAARADMPTLRADVAHADQALQRVVEYDALQGQQVGLEIERIRGEQRGMVVLLDGGSFALALVACMLAVRQLRRSARARQQELRDREQHAAELAAQNEALGQFGGRVAHDVLSPLASAMLSLELVRQTCADDRVATRTLDRGVASLNRVNALVDGLLAFARAGGQPEPGAAVELRPALADIVDGVALQAQQRNTAIALATVPRGKIACSAGVLTSVVTNLVGNALKYLGDSPERRIEIRTLDAGERWRIEISDTGPGIPRDQLERIFEPYYQIRRGGEGMGLGLATVDRLVRAHGGSVGVHSELGNGSLFWFEVPKVRAAVAPVACAL